MVAVGALNQAMNMGIDVPGDVSIIGFDDLEIAAWPCFRVTTVRVDLASMARDAADMIVGQLHGRRVVPTPPYATELVLRRTHASVA